MTVIYNLKTSNGIILPLEYEIFDNIHSHLWLKSLEQFCKSGLDIMEKDRVYNFNPSKDVYIKAINECNIVIDNINSYIGEGTIPHVRYDHLQDDVNHIHMHFVDSNRAVEYTKVCSLETWSALNAHLHGLEAIMRRKDRPNPQGQIFVELPEKDYYSLPEDAYQYFTVKKTFGYCYANYPHVGRHIYELFLANDNDARDDDILPMHQIAGSSYLWFGNTTNNLAVSLRMQSIENWFKEYKIGERINMEWGDPHLAIGWLPVAKLKNDYTPEDLTDVIEIDSVEVI